MRPAVAALLLSVLAVRIAAAPLTPGTVFKTDEDGGLVIVDKHGRAEEYRMRRATKILRDGRVSDSDRALIGDVVIRGTYDPKTKRLTLLELKTSAVKGEVALSDAIKGTLSVRVRKGVLREFTVSDATKILSSSEGKPEREVLFETVAVGDAVEVRSADGRLADNIRVRPSSP